MINVFSVRVCRERCFRDDDVIIVNTKVEKIRALTAIRTPSQLFAWTRQKMIGVPSLLVVCVALSIDLGETLKCYECTSHVSCGQGQASQLLECSGKCMVYRNQFDSGKKTKETSIGIHFSVRNERNHCSTLLYARLWHGRRTAYLRRTQSYLLLYHRHVQWCFGRFDLRRCCH